MANERSVQLLRDAISEIMSQPEEDTFWELSSLSAGIVGDDPELRAVFEEMTSPEERSVTFHLDGPGVEGHTTSAHHFGQFVAKVADATKELVREHVEARLAHDYVLVDAIHPGSVEVTLRAKKAAPPKKALSADRPVVPEHTTNVASDALAEIGQLLELAHRDDLLDDALDARIEPTPVGARKALRGLARQVQSAGWSVTATSRIRGERPNRFQFGGRGATALIKAIDRAKPKDHDQTVFAILDGFRESTGRLFLNTSSSGEKSESLSPIVESNELYVRAARLYASNPGATVKATIQAREKPAKVADQEPTTESVLVALEVVPEFSGEQTQIDVD